MSEDDRIPTSGEHRGVSLHCFQSAARLETVRADIDEAHRLSGAAELTAFAYDLARAPESRLFCVAKLKALFEIAVDDRRVRPAEVDFEKLAAVTAGLDSLNWIDPWNYGTLLNPFTRTVAPERERSLSDEEIDAARVRS